jgi:AraC-like DNA-binding protein
VKKYLLIAGALQIIIYLIVFMARMLPDWSFRRRNVILDITLFYSLSSLATTGFLVAGYITADVLYLKITALIGAFSTIFIYPLGQRYPRFYQILQTEAKERRYKKSLLGGLNVDLIMEHLTALMETERLYEDETITLKDLAERLLITPHQLSQLLNDTLHTNFNNFVNRYRITEAERILIDDPRRPVLTIAFDVGFNNKTSFYDAFSRFNGMSPHRYRKEKLRK